MMIKVMIIEDDYKTTMTKGRTMMEEGRRVEA
jgi:hypothetical protein